MANTDLPVYGMDAELAAKRAAKNDPALTQQARDWISAVLHVELAADTQEALKSGEHLCNLINAIQPGSVKKVNTSTMAFKCLENLDMFINACKAYGVKDTDLFQPVDLYENKNMPLVIQCIHALGAKAGANGFSPSIGVKLAEANARQFTEEQLAASRNAPSKISQGSVGGANQSGMVDHSRQIVKPGGEGHY
eukprot:TRINITY_DN21858_c0_g1_i1.p1 TRINITY_DN21858_c0_g1~~TRINITY_DN21858_c0_g1_i1.p1  ORF type:complete len:194 (-),score=44.86 TRINITY_DN21858_c0_g1_i1:37-618(-)